MISSTAINAVNLCVLLASHTRSGYMSMADLSQQLGLSVSNLESLLKLLRTHDLVLSSKGPGGGYMIKGSPAHIAIWDVVGIFLKNGGDASQYDALQPHESYITELEQLVQSSLENAHLSDFADFSMAEQIPKSETTGRFNFKPLPLPMIPKVPNSVFQLHMSL